MAIYTFSVGEVLTASNTNAYLADNASTAALTAGSVSNSATETVIGTLNAAIPANPEIDRGFNFRCMGSVDAASGGPTVTLRVRLDNVSGSIIGNSQAITALTGGGTGRTFDINCDLFVASTGASGSIQSACLFTHIIAATGLAQVTASTGASTLTMDTTVDHNVVITAQWSAASASNVARTAAGVASRHARP